MKKIVVCVLLVFTFPAIAQQSGINSLDSFFNKLEKDRTFNGNVLVARGNEVVYKRSIGFAEESSRRLLDENSVFELASVSKQFTAMGIMLLKQQGKLDYTDSLRKFFPQLPYYSITIRHLLHHTSGIPDYMELFSKHWDTTKIATNNDMISLLAAHHPDILFAPGEKWEYSNTGYALLSSVIEKVSGMSYAAFMEKYIFKPVGMSHSRVVNRRYNKKSLPDNYAFGYVFDQQRNKYMLPDSVGETASLVYCLDGITGDGAVNSTTGDLFRWSRALDEHKLVSKKMMEEALSPGTLNNGKAHQYGFGWMIGKSDYAGKIMNHSGGWPGYRTFIEKHPDSGTVIIVLTNYEKMPLPIKIINKLLYNIPEVKVAEVAMEEKLLKEYEGEYQLAPDFSITITVSNGHIYEQATGQGRAEIFAEKKDMFFLKIVEAKLKFIRNEKNEITSLILLQNGAEMEGKKIK